MIIVIGRPTILLRSFDKSGFRLHRLACNGYDGLMAHRKSNRTGDETALVRVVVQGLGFSYIVAPSNDDAGMQQNLFEPHLAVQPGHRSLSRIGIRQDANTGAGAFRQITEHMAGRQRHHQQIFGIVERGVAAKRGIRRAGKRQLAFDSTVYSRE